jgi:trehalose 6-phosphate synthase
MNLVAKEFVAAQDPEDPGVLILSRFAGAADQLRQALLVNPNSPEEIAEALKRALSMDRDERIARWKVLYDNIVTEDVTAWRDAFVSALSGSQRALTPDTPYGERARPVSNDGGLSELNAPSAHRPDALTGRAHLRSVPIRR